MKLGDLLVAELIAVPIARRLRARKQVGDRFVPGRKINRHGARPFKNLSFVRR